MLTLLRHSIADYICSVAFILVCKTTGISSPFLHTHHFYTLSFSLSLSICFLCVCHLCVCVCISLSAHDDISYLHVLLFMMQGTLNNTSEAVTHDCMHGCFMILLDSALYDAYLIHACCDAHPLSVSTQPIVHFPLYYRCNDMVTSYCNLILASICYDACVTRRISLPLILIVLSDM